MASTSMATPGRDREVSMSPRDSGVAGERMTASDDAVGPRKALDTAAAAELETALVPIWSALQDRRIDDARSMLARAQRLAEGSEAEPRVDRYETLIDYVTQFWQAVEAGMQGLEGSELPLDRGLVFVVEVNSSHVVVRVQGANRRFPRDRIPPRFALAVADRWLNDQAASSQVFRGAFLAVTPQFTRDDAEAAWRDAQRRGAPLDDLLLILQERP
jgi:hypothetical protein